MPLIAQLGRNFDPSLSASISGQELLAIACHKVQEAQFIIGGKTVYIECASNPKLFDFYNIKKFSYNFFIKEVPMMSTIRSSADLHNR